MLVGTLAVVLNALSFRTLDQPIWVGAAVGLAWTLLAIPVARAVNRRRQRLGHWPDTVALLAAANAAIVVGFGLLLDITFPTAESYLAIHQTAAGPNHSFAYGLVNTPREWVFVPLALLLNWHLARRRRPLLAAVAVLYVERVITYLYFAPTVLSWQDTTPAQTTPALLDEVGRWLRLDLARSPVDWLLLAALMVVVVAYPRVHGSALPAAMRDRTTQADPAAPWKMTDMPRAVHIVPELSERPAGFVAPAPPPSGSPRTTTPTTSSHSQPVAVPTLLASGFTADDLLALGRNLRRHRGRLPRLPHHAHRTPLSTSWSAAAGRSHHWWP